MSNSIQIFTYNGNDIAFDLSPQSIMINATEMASIFGTTPRDYLRSQQAENLVLEMCKPHNHVKYFPFQEADLLLEKKKEMLVTVIHGGRKNGTWIHRIIALDFAAWLNAGFRLWILETIEKILYGKMNEVNRINDERIFLEESIAKKETKYKKEVPDFGEYLQQISRLEKLNRQVTRIVKPSPQLDINY